MSRLLATTLAHQHFPHLRAPLTPKKQNATKQPMLKTTGHKPFSVPARDRVIDFGKHKGKMLGALPSNYLKWVSKTLRAGDTVHWAKLSDQVLEDTVYKDRLEWEFADNVLNGNNSHHVMSQNNEDAVSKLLEISERFGWDNEDKVGWSKINFQLLGTSQGGRIPRLPSSSSSSSSSPSPSNSDKKEEEEKGQNYLSVSEVRRKERRERRRREFEGEEKSKDNIGILGKIRGNLVSGVDRGRSRCNGDSTAEIHNPFPGREALLRRVLNGKRRRS